MFYWIVYNISWAIYLSFSLVFFSPLYSLVSLPLSFLPSSLSFPRLLFAWTFPETKVIPIMVEYYPLRIALHFSFLVLELTSSSPLLDLAQFYQCIWFLFPPRSSSYFIVPTSFIFVVYIFVSIHILSTCFRISFITLYFESFLFIFLLK